MNKKQKEMLFRLMSSMSGQDYKSYLEGHIIFARDMIRAGDTTYQVDLDVASELLEEELKRDN